MSGGITLATLRRTIPQFDVSLDVQIGDWVLVLPFRRGALLNHLSRESAESSSSTESSSSGGIITGPSAEPLDDSSIVKAVRSSTLLFPKLHDLLARHRTATNVSAEPENSAASSSILGEREARDENDIDDDGEGLERRTSSSPPAKRRRLSREGILGAATTSLLRDEVKYEEDDTLFFLHIPTRTLTTRRPAVFGGSDYVEWMDGTSSKRVYVNWITGECSDSHLVLAGPPMPRWITEVTERAEREFELWQRRTIKRASQSN